MLIVNKRINKSQTPAYQYVEIRKNSSILKLTDYTKMYLGRF